LIVLRLEDSHSNLRGYSKVARRKIAELGGLTSLAAFPKFDETNIVPLESRAYIDSNKVLQRFTHFETSNVEMPSMQEVIDPLATVMISLQFHQYKSTHITVVSTSD
jgi:hypothetical protein